MNVSIDEIEKSASTISKPEIVGQFSLDHERKYRNDLSQLKYYKPPSRRRVNFDLKKDQTLTIFKHDENELLTNLLKWMSENLDVIKRKNSEGNTGDRWLKPEIVCYRGLLTAILCTPFDNKNGWVICASKLKGTIYLCAFDSDEQKRQKANENDYGKACSIWGFKFEQYMLSDSPTAEPDVSTPLNENEEFCCIFTSRLGGNSLLYGAEMDGICSEESITDTLVGRNVEFIELKTLNQRLYQNGSIVSRRADRAMKWWCQSYLVGVQSIVSGLRTDNGFVREIKEFKLKELSLEKYGWHPNKCLSFCNGFLELVKKVVREDHDKCLYKFTLGGGSNFVRIEHMKPDPKSEFAFLPKWYIDKIQEQI